MDGTNWLKAASRQPSLQDAERREAALADVDEQPVAVAPQAGRSRRQPARALSRDEQTGDEHPAAMTTSWFHPFFRDGAASGCSVDLPPAFFVVGAPRCGTTSLSKALKVHPRISFSKPKETHFFVRCDPDLEADELRRVYVGQHHPDLSGVHEALGDGSVSYLYSPRAVELALRFDSRARFVVMVRNPVDMVPSYHARMVYTLDEDVADFAKAWSLQDRRAAGHDIPKRCRDPRLLQYGEVGRLGQQLERLFEIAGRERCLVIVFDDFAKAPGIEFRRVLEFVGVTPEDTVKVRVKAAHRRFKSPWLQQFVINPPPWLISLMTHGGKRAIRPLRGVRKRLESLNTERTQRATLSEATRELLRDYFAGDVAKLSELLQRDLSHWR